AKIVFSGVGKTRAEMARALDVGVLCFNVESEAELAVLSQVAVSAGKPARVSLRINPDVDAGTHPYISTGLKDNRLGVAHGRASARAVMAIARSCSSQAARWSATPACSSAKCCTRSPASTRTSASSTPR